MEKWQCETDAFINVESIFLNYSVSNATNANIRAHAFTFNDNYTINKQVNYAVFTRWLSPTDGPASRRIVYPLNACRTFCKQGLNVLPLVCVMADRQILYTIWG